MPLALLVGPANAGKVASLLDRYLACIDREPFLVVPNRGEIERIERDLLRRSPVLLGGSIGTFDDLFERIAGGSAAARPLLSRLERTLLLADVVSRARLTDLESSARFTGFSESLGEAISELEAGLVEPHEVGGELGELYRDYRDALDRLGAWDRGSLRRAAVERLGTELDAWTGAPVLVYGFEDLSGVQQALLDSLAGRCEVTVSLPYEPGRLAFEALRRAAEDLSGRADAGIDELDRKDWYEAPALARLERYLYVDRLPDVAPELDGAIGFLEGAGTRATLELVAEEILALLRDGSDPERIAVVLPSVEQLRRPLETAFGALGVPYAVQGRLRLSRTPLGRSLLGLLRFAWLGGGRMELFAFLRSPYSGLARGRVDFVEGRLRGRAVREPERVEAEAVRFLGQPLEALDGLRAIDDPVSGTRRLAASMVQCAWGLDRPPVDELARADLRAEEAVDRALRALETWRERGQAVAPEDVAHVLEQATLATRADEPGRVRIVDLLEARTQRFDHVFVLGLEEGSLPSRAVEGSFLPDERRRELELRVSGRKLVRADQLARDRYLFYTACTRAWKRLVLVRQAATDDGRPLEPSPFWDEVRSLFSPAAVARATRRRPLSALAWDVHAAPSERERLRAVAVLSATDETQARSLASAGGWTRQIERALGAWERPTRLVSPVVLRELGETTRFSATELERFVDCSSMWFVERVVDPRQIDPELDARLRGTVAHAALYRFFGGIPKRFGTDTVDAGRLDEAIEYLQECLDAAIASHVRLELPDVALLELRGALARDLEQFLRREVELGLPLVPRRLEVAFGSDRAAPELQRGLELGGFTVSGKIDRIDVDPFSARGIVQDYKSGEAFSAARIESSRRLQIPLYILALRDLVGVEPLGGVYRSLSGDREARGLLRAEARADLPGLARHDYLDEDEFWGQIQLAVERSRDAVARLRAGDVRHDPRDGECPSWCSLWSMCRVTRT